MSERVVKPEFFGSATEYFRIWIVNLFFTLATFGVYSAWAKVRKKRYLYGSTRIDGDSFDYFASPKAILKGRLVAVAVFVIYAAMSELYPASRYAFWALAIALLPWLVLRAVSFNARNSAYRGLRFDFQGRLAEAVRLYIGKLLVVGLTAGIAFPWFMARQKAYLVSNHAFGTTRFDCKLSAREFFSIYMRSGLLMLAVVVPSSILMGFAITSLELPESILWVAYVLPAIPMYLAYTVAFAYVHARTGNLLWNGTRAPGVRFESSVSAKRLAGLYIGNILAAACTAGLLIPWAVIRTLKYKLDNFRVMIDGNPVFEANPSLLRVGAASQELGDIFNLDLGL